MGDGFSNQINDFSNFDLLKESQKLTTLLKNQITNIPPAKGGYILFLKYKNLDEFLSIFILRDTQTPVFNTKNNIVNIEKVTHLNISDFAMGAKINLTSLKQNKDERYIQFARGNTEIAEYFQNWLGIDDAREDQEDSKILLEVSKIISLDTNIIGINNRDELRKYIYDYSKNNNKKINTDNLSEAIYGDSSFISKFCEKENLIMNHEFKLTNSKSFYKVNAKSNGIELSVEREKINRQEGIRLIKEKKEIIINDKDLVEKIINQLD